MTYMNGGEQQCTQMLSDECGCHFNAVYAILLFKHLQLLHLLNGLKTTEFKHKMCICSFLTLLVLNVNCTFNAHMI